MPGFDRYEVQVAAWGFNVNIKHRIFVPGPIESKWKITYGGYRDIPKTFGQSWDSDFAKKTMFILTIRVVFCCLDNNITNVNGIQKISDAMR